MRVLPRIWPRWLWIRIWQEIDLVADVECHFNDIAFAVTKEEQE